jgi:CheY-like chemotaxis protein/HPt (histidine-containing phosphotransfer) domain-containing protein
LSLLRSRAAEHNVQLNYEVRDGVPEVIASDPVRLKQLLMNLLSNAVKFTPAGTVCVVVRPAGQETGPKLAFDVIDSGIGIPPGKLDAIFEAFVQADNSVTRQYGGTGLGLPISRRIARAMGGDLAVHSELGKGSTFTATIDAAPCKAQQVQADSPTEKADLPSDRLAWAMSVLKGKRILVVDDGPSNRKLISLVLRRAGVEATMAEDGQRAVDLAGSGAFDLILMDMQMPVMDGYTATRQLRNRGLDIPIIALTAHAMREDQNKCLDAGCSGYLPKPIQQDLLLTELAQALGSRSDQDGEGPGKSRDNTEPPLVSTLPLDDPEFCEIVEEFVLSLPDQLRELHRALAAADFPELVRLAHRLKGAGGMAGFDDLMAASKQVEDLARKQDGEGVAMTLKTLSRLCSRATYPRDGSPAPTPG